MNIIMVYLNQYYYTTQLKTIIIITISYIFWSSRWNKSLDIIILKTWIHTTYNKQSTTATSNNKNELFTKQWNTWLNIFNMW